MSTKNLEFNIEPKIGAGIRKFFYSQLFVTPPYPRNSFTNQTVIVTGSNVGLGLEAARHFYRLDCAKLILAVRTISKGEIAKEDIFESVKTRNDANAIEVWELDLSSTSSVLAFAEKAKTLERVDVLVENAGINNNSFVTFEGMESNVQVNVVNTFLLALSVLPKMTETKKSFPDSAPHLVVVSSEAHHLTRFVEVNDPDIYRKLNDEEGFDKDGRYQITKLMEVLFLRELVARLSPIKSTTPPPVLMTLINPGLCKSKLSRGTNKPSLGQKILWTVLKLLLERPTEMGARVMVIAAGDGAKSHGMYQSDGKNQEVESWILGEMGKRVQMKVFEQTMKVLENRKPGIGASIGLETGVGCSA